MQTTSSTKNAPQVIENISIVSTLPKVTISVNSNFLPPPSPLKG